MRTNDDQTYVQAQALTAGADFAGNTINIWQSFGFAMQASWTSVAALTGTIKMQASNNGSTWSDLPNPVAIAGTSGSQLWNVPDTFFKYVRIYYAHTSGTGTLNSTIVAKGI